MPKGLLLKSTKDGTAETGIKLESADPHRIGAMEDLYVWNII